MSKFTTISGVGNAPNYAIIAVSLLEKGFGIIGNLKIVASISNIFILTVFGMVNVALLRYRYKHRKGEDNRASFHIRGNINNIPVLTVLALVTILLLFGYNIYNLLQGKV